MQTNTPETRERTSMAKIPEITLSSGGSMPVLGMGTASYPVTPPEIVESAILEAIKLGYRHFDTAGIYGSELPLGRAISRALESGLIASRSELFITSKLWCTDAYHAGVLPAIQETLRCLGLEYVDLYLIHFPVRLRGEKSSVGWAENVMEPFDMSGTWEGMEECYGLGLAKSIGVSNFTCRKLDQLLSHANIPPAVNQVEMHPLWQQKKLRDYCKEKNIHVSAYSPLGGGMNLWGSLEVLDSGVIQKIAKDNGKTTGQVCLRWAFEQGVSFLPKSFNKQRLKENMDIFDWKLNEDELEKLGNLTQKKILSAKQFISANGVYKSLSDFWDGEI